MPVVSEIRSAAGGVVTESAIRKRQSVRFGLGRSDYQTPSISGGGQRRVPVRANSQPVGIATLDAGERRWAAEGHNLQGFHRHRI